MARPSDLHAVAPLQTHVGSAVLALVLMVAPATSHAQTPLPESEAAPTIARDGPREWSARPPAIQEEEARKSAVAAAILGAYVPLAGYAYAGRWKRGLAPQALWFAFAGGMTYAADCDATGGCSSTEETIGALAWTAGVVSVFWGGIGAFRTARTHNRALDQRLEIEARPGFSGGVSVAVRVFLSR